MVVVTLRLQQTRLESALQILCTAATTTFLVLLWTTTTSTNNDVYVIHALSSITNVGIITATQTGRSRSSILTLNVAINPVVFDDADSNGDKNNNNEMNSDYMYNQVQKVNPTSVVNTWMDEYNDYTVEMDRIDQMTETTIQQKQNQIKSRYFQPTTTTGRSSSTSMMGSNWESFRVQVPLMKSNVPTTNVPLFGITVAEVIPGRKLSLRRLNLDTMRTEIISDNNDDDSTSMKLQTILNNNIYGNYRGLIITSIHDEDDKERSILQQQFNVQVGDVITAVSATMGDKIWPTSTMQGLQSAISSRKITSSSHITFEIRRPIIATESLNLTASTKSEELRTTNKQQDLSSSSSLPYSTLVLPISTTNATTTSEAVIPTSSTAAAQQVQQQYELTLSRPLCFQIGENSDGYVVVTGFNPKTITNLVRHAVQIGDRIIAIDTSFSSTLWPVSTVEGVISAATGRLPGQPVTIRFERPLTNPQSQQVPRTDSMSTTKDSVDAINQINTKNINPDQLPTSFATIASSSVDVAFPETKQATAIIGSGSTGNTRLTEKELIQRCRDVLRRYSLKQQQQDDVAMSGAQVSLSNTATGSVSVENRQQRAIGAVSQLNVLVADKVVDALASASATIDSVTLSMIMNAYMQSQAPLSAIRIFEAATGFAGDGSTNEAIGSTTIVGKTTGNRISPSESSLNLYTGTILLSAHAALGDYKSVARVLAALEGRSGIPDEDTTTANGEILESAPWPWTGAYGSIQPDTVCYNTALAAAERIGGAGALSLAQELFHRMSDPVLKSTNVKKSTASALKESSSLGPVRNEVTYNTMMSAYCNAGQSDQALQLFDQMQRVGLRPDKYTYTVLIQACDNENDVQELLYAMSERGIQPDIVTYNTIIKSLCSKRKLTQATKIVTEMESRGIIPDSRTYGTLMSGLLKAGKPSSCLTLFESAYSNSRTLALTENVHLYTTAITAAAQLGNHERALDLVTRMTALGLKPTLQTLTAVMGACLSSGKPDLAIQLYQKIDSPDGYAMSQAIRACYENNDIERALTMIATQKRGSRLLTGQQMMHSYQGMLAAALRLKDYPIARRIIQDLLEKGYIPSKAILNTIYDTIGVNNRVPANIDSNDEDLSRFKFLLSLLDLLRIRNLPVESSLYMSTLTVGAQLGGLPRKIASLLSRAKSKEGATTKENLLFFQNILEITSENQVGSAISGWEELLEKYDSVPKESLSLYHLPQLPVRVAPKDVARLLRVEQSVTYNNRRNNQRGILRTGMS